MTTQENIVGGKELADLLGTLPAKVEKNIMRAALRAGAAVYLEEVRRRIPQDTGALASTARITTRGQKGNVSASVKVGNSQVWYAHLVEFGTRPHTIKARPGHALQIDGRDVEKVQHPGARPQPYMRPAADVKFSAAVAAVQAKVRQRLTKQGLEVPEATPAGENAP